MEINGINETYAARKKVTLIMAIVALIMIIGGGVFHRAAEPTIHFALGVILTTAFNAIKLFMIVQTAEKIADIENEARGRSFAGVQYLIRFLLTMAVFLVAAFAPFVDLFGAVFGIFTMQTAMYIWRLMEGKKSGI